MTMRYPAKTRRSGTRVDGAPTAIPTGTPLMLLPNSSVSSTTLRTRLPLAARTMTKLRDSSRSQCPQRRLPF